MAVNDLTDTKTLAHLLKYDSVHGRFHGDVEAARRRAHGRRRHDPGALREGSRPSCPGRSSASTSCSSPPAGSPTATRRRSTSTAGAKKVIISAPAKKEDITIVYGVNHDEVRPRQAPRHLQRELHHQLPGAGGEGDPATRSASCSGFMTTVHSYTNDQQILDLPHKDLRRARAAALSIIPTTHRRRQGDVAGDPGGEGQDRRRVAPRADARRLGGGADLRRSRRPTTAEEVNAAFREAAAGRAQGRAGGERRAAGLGGLHRQPRSRAPSTRCPPTWSTARWST